MTETNATEPVPIAATSRDEGVTVALVDDDARTDAVATAPHAPTASSLSYEEPERRAVLDKVARLRAGWVDAQTHAVLLDQADDEAWRRTLSAERGSDEAALAEARARRDAAQVKLLSGWVRALDDEIAAATVRALPAELERRSFERVRQTFRDAASGDGPREPSYSAEVRRWQQVANVSGIAVLNPGHHIVAPSTEHPVLRPADEEALTSYQAVTAKVEALQARLDAWERGAGPLLDRLLHAVALVADAEALAVEIDDHNRLVAVCDASRAAEGRVWVPPRGQQGPTSQTPPRIRVSA